MKLQTAALLAVGGLSTAILAACGGGGSSSAEGTVVMGMADAAADMGAVTSVKVTVNSVKVHASGGAWTDVSTKSQTYDLLQLKAKGTTELLAQTKLKAQSYDQLELGISKVVVTDKQGDHEAKLPSNTLKFKGNLEVKANSTATARFDIKTDKSLHMTGKGEYILAPVVQLDTRSDAQAKVESNNTVTITGGTTTASGLVGTDIEGNVDAGLSISSDAILELQGSKVVQSKGRLIIGGTIKAVTADSVTITTASGQDVQLQTSGSSTASLQPGTVVVASYDAASKASAQVESQASVEAKLGVNLGVGIGGTPKPTTPPPPTATPVNAGATVSAQANATATGTLKAIDAAKGTITLTTTAGAELTLNVAATAKITVDGATATIATLATKVGAKLTAEYNSSTNTATSVSAQAQASAGTLISGTLGAVSVLANTVTVKSSAGADLVLNITPQSKLTINGTAATSASLTAVVGKPCTAEYGAQAKTVTSLNVQG